MLDVSKEELIKKRAAFFEEKLISLPHYLLRIAKNKIDYYRIYLKQTEITLWFEHDRYDQTMLMHYSMNY